MEWSCCRECKAVTKAEVPDDVIVNLKQVFQEPMQELRTALDANDEGCPHEQYTTFASKDPDSNVVELQKSLLGLFSTMGDVVVNFAYFAYELRLAPAIV